MWRGSKLGYGGEWLAPSALALLALAPAARAQTGAPAGTVVVNTAVAHADVGGTTITVASNAASFTVAERVAPVLAPDAPPGFPSDAPPSVVLTNGGNGTEAFVVTASAPDGSAVPVAADADGDGRYEAGLDPVLPGGLTNAMPPGAAMTLFVPGAAGDVTLAARAATGADAPGGTATTRLSADRQPTLTKSQALAAADGVARPGGIVTYLLIAAFPSARADARVEDRLPAGAAYVPGSLRLDGAPLTDEADADAGAVADGVVAVSLGNAPAGVAHAVTFQVKLR